MSRTRIKELYFFILIIFSGLGLPFFRNQMAMVYFFMLTVAMFLLFKVKISRILTKVVIIWLLYCLSFIFRYGELMEYFILRHLTYILVTYLMVVLYKDVFFRYFENYMFALALISLLFYFWEIFNFNSLYFFIDSFDLIRGGSEFNAGTSKSILLYTLHHRAIAGGVHRNCGFAWEPGPFSVFIVIALYLNMLRTKMKVKGNTRFYIFLITIATTQSTTGFIAVALVFLDISLRTQKGFAKYFMFFLLGIIFVYLFFRLDFLSEKIIGLYQSGDAETIISRAEQSGRKGSFGRFAGYSIGWEDFKNHPLFGYAGVNRLSITSDLVGVVNMVSGLAALIGMYGLFGILLLVYFLRKSTINIAQYFDAKTKFSLAIILLVGLAGFHIHTMPILFAFMFFSLFTKQATQLIVIDNKSISKIPNLEQAKV